MQNTEYQVSMACPDQTLKSCPNGPIMKKQFTKKGNIEGCAFCCAICTEKGACKFTCDAVRATLTPAAPARTLDQIEADIAAQLEMGAQLREMYLQAFAKASTPILIRIGECLKEEKEACKAAKISFADRIRERFGFSQRTAENYMTLAAEISPDSPIAQLPYTKALALTALPSGEREAFAAEVGADSLSKKQLQDAIKEKQEAERRAQEAESRIKRAEDEIKLQRSIVESVEQERSHLEKRNATNFRALEEESEKRRKAEQELEKARDELSTAQRDQDALKEQLESLDRNQERHTSELRGRIKELEEQLRSAEGEVRYVETTPDDYDELKRQNALLTRRAEEAENYAAEAEEAMRDAQNAAQRAQMDAMNSEPAAANPLDVAPFADSCAALLNKLYSAPYSASFFSGKSAMEIARYRINAENVLNWANGVLDALRQAQDMQTGGVDYEVR